MKQTKQIFFKTVRPNGDSVWAPKGLNRNYQVGKTYRFPKHLPAHVFDFPYNDVSDLTNQRIVDFIYNHRKESDGGNRVLVCEGYCTRRYVPVIELGEWNFDMFLSTGKWLGKQKNLLTSTCFKVIGELKPTIVDETVATKEYYRLKLVGKIPKSIKL